MRRLVSAAAAVGMAATLAFVAAPPASAVTIADIAAPTTGRTAVTTATGIAPAIVKAGVLPYAVSPGRLDGVSLSPLKLRFSFPITGLQGGTFAGNVPNEITHSGGIAFVKLGSFTKRIVVSDFTIDLNGGDAVGQKAQPQLIGTVRDGVGGVPDGARVALFDIDLGPSTVDINDVQVRGAVLRLTSVAGAALDAELGTSLFSAVAAAGTPVFTARANA